MIYKTLDRTLKIVEHGTPQSQVELRWSESVSTNVFPAPLVAPITVKGHNSPLIWKSCWTSGVRC